MATKRLFSVTVHTKPKYDETGTHKIVAKDDLEARKKAIPLFVKEYNAINDRNYKNDKDDWMDGDPPIRKSSYTHISEKDIDYCETSLLEEWKQ